MKKVGAFLALLIGIGVMAYTGTRLLEAQRVYQEGNAAYEDLHGRVKKNPAHAPEPGIDFAALQAIHPDAAAWLYSPGTAIDYPVMKAGDYAYYLNHLPDGTVNANGSLFIDYNCNADFNDPLTVVYGHHMKSGNMFGSLKGYKEQSYYEEHPYMYLFTKQGNYRIDLLYGCVIGAGQWRERAFMYPENTGALLAYAARNTTFTSGAAYAEGDKVVALSTCSYDFEDARYIVVGILNEVEQF